MEMTQEQLVRTLMGLRGATFVTFEAHTEPDIIAGSPFRGVVRKVAVVNGTINFIYQNSVNNQREREDLTPDFEPFPRKWGRRIPRTPLVVHQKDGEEKYYLEVKVERSIQYEYRDNQGNVIPKEAVTPWLRPTGRSRQGVQKPVVLRDYTLTNVHNLILKGEHIAHSDAEAA